jgi:hypothetical protein
MNAMEMYLLNEVTDKMIEEFAEEIKDRCSKFSVEE